LSNQPISQQDDQQDSQEMFQLENIGCQRLAATVILQAVEEAMHSDPDIYFPAREWLAAEGVLWIKLLGFNPRAVLIWLKEGCKRREEIVYQDADDLYYELLFLSKMIIRGQKRKRKRGS
jgi:hypothetical protein